MECVYLPWARSRVAASSLGRSDHRGLRPKKSATPYLAAIVNARNYHCERTYLVYCALLRWLRAGAWLAEGLDTTLESRGRIIKKSCKPGP